MKTTTEYSENNWEEEFISNTEFENEKYWNSENEISKSTKSQSTEYFYRTPPTYSYQNNFYDTEKKKDNRKKNHKSGIFTNSGFKLEINVPISLLLCQILLMLYY